MFVCISRKLLSRQLEPKKSSYFVSYLASFTSLVEFSCRQSSLPQQISTRHNNKQITSTTGISVTRSYSLIGSSLPVIDNTITSKVLGIKMISDENISPNKIPKSKKTGKTIEETYQKKTQLEHILLRYV